MAQDGEQPTGRRMKRSFRTIRDTTPGRWVISEQDPTGRPLRLMAFGVLVICLIILVHTALTDPRAFHGADNVYSIWTIPGALASAVAFAASFMKRKARPSDFDHSPELRQKLDRAVAAYDHRRRDLGPSARRHADAMSSKLEDAIGRLMYLARSVKGDYRDVAFIPEHMRHEMRAYEMDNIDDVLHTLEDDAAFLRLKNETK